MDARRITGNLSKSIMDFWHSSVIVIEVLHGAERGDIAALFLSPLSLEYKNQSGVDLAQSGCQLTFFLTAPSQAFCQLVDYQFTNDNMDVYNEMENILSTFFSKWDEILCTAPELNLVCAQLLCDPFLWWLILRFIFCRAALTLFHFWEKDAQHLPVCIPDLPNSLFGHSNVVQPAIVQLDHSLCFV